MLSAAVAQVALPLARATAAQPEIDTPPSRKLTVPVATPADPVTLAVKVTDWPAVDGFAEEARATAGFAFTLCWIAELVAGL